MIISDKDYYIYLKRDHIREYILLSLLLSSLYSLITNYNKINFVRNPESIELIFSVFYITLSVLILKNASDIDRYARRHNIDLKKLKYIKSYDKILLYIYLTIAFINIFIIFKNKYKSPIQIIKLFFSIFFMFAIIYYYNFLF
jgi:hypothetical protein